MLLIFVETKINIMTKLRKNQQADVQLSNLPFIIGGIIIVGITLLTVLTA
jgi:hypothetical protein